MLSILITLKFKAADWICITTYSLIYPTAYSAPPLICLIDISKSKCCTLNSWSQTCPSYSHLHLNWWQFHQSICERESQLCVKVAQLCLTLCDPMDYTAHGILQDRILEWVAIPFSRGSVKPRDWTRVSQIAGGFFTSWATRKSQSI